jgi:hypothetical protein
MLQAAREAIATHRMIFFMPRHTGKRGERKQDYA